MLFNSLSFLIFFPIVTTAYFLIPNLLFKKSDDAFFVGSQNIILFFSGCFFYMAFLPKYILILFLLIGIDFWAALKLGESHKRSNQTPSASIAEAARRKNFLVLSLVANIGILAFFKYTGFFIDNAQQLLLWMGMSWSLPAFKILLPLGLSFHTFQSMSYTLEVYRGTHPAEKNLLTYAVYVLFYPQLVAGPIERPQHLLPQLNQKHEFDFLRLLQGFQKMCWGFFKKMFVADRMAQFVNSSFGSAASVQSLPSSAHLILATYLFTFQIYCDFSGYSDIAIGAARVMGVDLAKNFFYPYSSRSISEFWRRWHISLSTWFRDYLYIPLGGNRVPRARFCFNVFFVFLMSGFWHGASWNFILWGALHGAYLYSETMLKKYFSAISQKVPDFFTKIFTFHLVAFAWIFFRAESFAHAKAICLKILLLDAESNSMWMTLFTFVKKFAVLSISNDVVRASLLGLFFLWVGERLERKISEKNFWRNSPKQFYFLAAYSAFLISLILTGAPLNENVFIYFQF